jgi:hypothetical protein
MMQIMWLNQSRGDSMGSNFTWTLELLHNGWLLLVFGFMIFLGIYHAHEAIEERKQRKRERT